MGTEGEAGREPRMMRHVHAAAAGVWGRSLLTMVAAFGVLWCAVGLLESAVVAVAFGSPMGVVMAIAVLVIAVAVIAGISKRLTGKRVIGAAVWSAVTLVVGLAVAMASFREIPFLWVPALGMDVVLPGIAAIGALVLGLAMRPWPLRVAGGLAVVVVAASVVQVVRPEPPDPELNRVLTPEEQFEWFTSTTGPARVPAGDGYRVVSVSGFDDVYSTVLTPAGDVLRVRVDTQPDYDSEGVLVTDPRSRACEALMGALQPNGETEYQESDCVISGMGWARQDGSGIAWIWNGDLLVVTAADEWYVSQAGGSGPATADEVADAAFNLRPITEAELRVVFSNTLVEGER